MKGAAILLAVLLSQLSSAAAADLSTLYSKPTLEYWQPRYVRSCNKILDEVIWPALLTQEKQKFDGKPALELPIWALAEMRQNPLAYYSTNTGNRIVLPVLSLKFLDDLCTAYAWLQINGYDLETISEYTAILRFGKPPPAGFPPPLRALGIPEAALEDRRVDELPLGHFVTARTFIILHEMGHIFSGRVAHSPADEREADAFAAKVMQRTPLPPLGMLVYFLADAHSSSYPAQAGDTHPLSGARVSALADHVDERILATKLRQLGLSLDDPDIRTGFVASGKAGDFAALAPRRTGELPSTRAAAESRDRGVLFSGTYRGEFVQSIDPENSMRIEVTLERDGDKVQGRYSFGLWIGSIRGTVIGRKLHYDWRWAGNYGYGVMEAADENSFIGEWGIREAASGAGRWTGKRVP